MLENYLIVHKSILPDYFMDVLKTKHLIEEGKAKNVSQAVKITGISRSTFYKYKDYIFEPNSVSDGRKAVLSMMLTHAPGILSAVLSLISDAGASVLTITQSLPVHEHASVTITLDISAMPGTIAELLDKIGQSNGVENPRLVAVD